MESKSPRFIGRIISYLLLWYVFLITSLVCHYLKLGPAWLQGNVVSQIYMCALIGGFGGVTYLLRGVYVNACAKKSWDPEWWPWYLIRPFLSVLMGAVSFVVVNAGLLLIGADEGVEDPSMGIFFLAFIAGLNVDKFVSKLEEMAETLWGIERSRSSKDK